MITVIWTGPLCIDAFIGSFVSVVSSGFFGTASIAWLFSLIAIAQGQEEERNVD